MPTYGCYALPPMDVYAPPPMDVYAPPPMDLTPGLHMDPTPRYIWILRPAACPRGLGVQCASSLNRRTNSDF